MTQISHALAAKMGSRKLSAHPHSAVVSSPEIPISQSRYLAWYSNKKKNYTLLLCRVSVRTAYLSTPSHASKES